MKTTHTFGIQFIIRSGKKDKEKITPENIKALFLGDSDEHTLIELVDYHNTTQASVLSPGTMKNYRTTKKVHRTVPKKEIQGFGYLSGTVQLQVYQ